MRIPASTLTETLRRRLTGAALPLLAAALLLALPTVAAAQVQRVLVISYTEPATDPAPPLTVTEHEADASADPPNDVCRTTYDVKLNTEPSSAVTVTVVSGDTTVAQVNPKTLTFTISESGTEWHTAQPVTVYCVDDDVDNPGDERSVTITHTPSGGGFGTAASVQVTVYDDVDDDAEILLFDSDVQAVTTAPLLVATVDERGADQTDSYSVRLKTEPTDDVIVDVTSGDTVGATISPASLTFTPTNWSETQTVTVTGVDDSVDNPDTPGSRSVTITHTPRDGGGYGSGETKTATVTVNDEGDAPASPTEGLEYSPSQPVVLEGQQAVYTVKLRTKPTGTVTLYLSKDVSTHLKSFDPSELTFTTTNWDTPQSVTVTGFDDDVDDADQARTTTITHRPSGGGYEDAANTTLEVGLRDDDTAGLLLSRSAVPLVDAGNTVSYTVVLRSEPIGTVTVAVDDATPPGSDPDSAVQSVSPSELTFTADNWDTRQTVTITAEN